MAKSNKRPNVLFLMTDQQRWDALGSVNPLVSTPHLDALAARGVRFTQATCNAPMCVPSRYSMMTGLYPSQVGVRHNTQVCAGDEELPLPVLPQRMHEAGYQTAGFGKTHWYFREPLTPDAPLPASTRGFEIRAHRNTDEPSRVEPGAATMGGERPEEYAALRAETGQFGRGGANVAGYKGITSSVAAEGHTEAWLTDKALEFLEHDRDESRPFFLYLSFDFPHAGFNVPQGYEELYDLDEIPDPFSSPQDVDLHRHVGEWKWREEWSSETTACARRRSTLRYYALCSYVDAQFGRVLHKLEEAGELDDTFVVFTSDHGEMLGDRRRFSKYCLYEASVRIPLILAGPGVSTGLRGATDDRYAELVDVVPTLLQIAGQTAPELPGSSLLDEPARAGCFAEMHGSGYEERQTAPAYMWRTREWKLILHLPGEAAGATARIDEARGELYDLRTDPHEYDNLYEDPGHLPVRERLTRELLMHLASAWAKHPHQSARARLS